MPSLHVAPFWQGDEPHSWRLVVQFAPAQPEAHLHEYAALPSLHVAPFLHGLLAHSLTSMHLPARPVPVNPLLHAHVKFEPFLLSVHVAFPSQSSKEILQ